MVKPYIPNTLPPLSIGVSSTTKNPTLLEKASDLAELLKIELLPPADLGKYDLLLLYTEKGLQIQLKQDNKTKKPATLYIDFLSDALTYRREHGGGIKQSLARAVGVKPGIRPSVIDATAGLGRDSFLLASFGCRVTMIERSPLLAALLHDALERAIEAPSLQADITNRLNLLQGDAATIIAGHQPSLKADTIYLDPMYPHGRKSALNRLEMRLIRTLVGDDSDAAVLLRTALHYAQNRVVVKRPKGAPLLDKRIPSHVIKMKNSRYDVYMT